MLTILKCSKCGIKHGCKKDGHFKLCLNCTREECRFVKDITYERYCDYCKGG